MEVSGQQYFEWCHQLFRQREEGADSHCDYFLSIGGNFTVRIKFAGEHLISAFTRALAHLATEPIANPDVTVCVWDNSNPHSLFLSPFGKDSERSRRHTCSNIQIACEIWPNRVSLFSAERKLGLFWISDVRQIPWYELCQPLRNIMHWSALSRQLYMVHAACIGTEQGGVLLPGTKGVGKSTTSMATLTSNSDMSFAGDDICLIGFEEKKPFVYSLYNTGKLENFERLPLLEEHACNRHRLSGEKAYIHVNESFPAKLIKKTPLAAIVVPTITGERLSALRPLATSDAFRILVASSGERLGGAAAADFFGLYKVCKTTPSYALASGEDLDHLNMVLHGCLGRKFMDS